MRAEVSDPIFEQDGLRLVTVASEALRGRGDLTLWPGPANGDRPRGLVLLLHGVQGSHWSWSLQGGAHRTLARLIAEGEVPPVALVMPSDGLWGDGTGYVRHHGRDYGRWVIDEVPRVAGEIAELAPQTPLFIGGLSMGGYGALRLAALHPNQVRAVSAHSVVTRLADLARFGVRVPHPDDVDDSELDVIDAIRSSAGTLPALRFDCGRQDELLAANRELHQQLVALNIAHDYEEADGSHDWSYWSNQLPVSFRWFGQFADNG